ncbi:hypothetical protein J6590_052138 [Homalodisca vitripennis]|nr:hypothetical protein J6590_052138 [Homalodisca vitripennis]
MNHGHLDVFPVQVVDAPPIRGNIQAVIGGRVGRAPQSTTRRGPNWSRNLLKPITTNWAHTMHRDVLVGVGFELGGQTTT